MATLFDTTPSHIRLLQAPGQAAACWILSYGVPDGAVHKLPAGRRFAHVSSPNDHAVEALWKLTQFEAREKFVGIPYPPVRSYAQVGQRVLTPEEIAHLKTLIENYRKEQANAAPELPKEDSPGTEEQTGTGSAQAGDPAGTAPADGPSVAHFMAEESQRPLRLQEPEMA
ncbi:MAG: hypothetical protein K8L97_01605 [Anaerolineae bacterium]|nr:hypothetical protein [Anaerolineae bacterium]